MSGEDRSSEVMRIAALLAHQLQSPLNAASMSLYALLGDYAGPLAPRQRDLADRAHQKCLEATRSVQRVLRVCRFLEKPETARGVCDAAASAHRAVANHMPAALRARIDLQLDIAVMSATVPLHPDAMDEVLESLLSNALKYTPDHGRVRCRVAWDLATGEAVVTVGDSGIGIPADQQGRVFEAFYRGSGAEGSTRPGVGLGLSFVRQVVEAAGGSATAGSSELGGAEIALRLPLLYDELPAAQEGEVEVPEVLRVVVIGGVAAGPKVASKVIRLNPTADVTIIEKGELLSYVGCGLPYYVSGVVRDQRELMATAAGAVRDPVFFQKVKNVHVLNRTEAVEVDRAGKRVRVVSAQDGKETWLPYDKLMFATGAKPVVPPIPGIDLPRIYTLHGVSDAEGVRATLAEDKAKDLVIVGGGLIGVEMTEALVERGCRVTIVEMVDQILPMLDWEMARHVELHLESHGVKVMTGTRVEAFKGDGRVQSVVTTAGEFPTDAAVLSIGVRLNTELAKAAGLEIGKTGAIRVDDHMRTSDPEIYAAGDCVESINLVTGQPCFVPLGSTANKQGRVAAVNLTGGDDTFPGVLGSTVCKVFDFCVGRTGLTERQAVEAGYDVVSVLSPAPDSAHYMPTAKLIMLKLVVDRKTRKLLGLQGVGPGHADKRIDIAAMAITAGMTVDALAKADLCYAPPYSPAMDNIITACDIARNKLDGMMDGITPMAVQAKREAKEDFVFLDVRSPAEYEESRIPGTVNIPLGALRGRVSELPADKEVITFCKISLRGYEAALILKAAGFERVRVMDGGLAMWPYEKVS